MKKYIIPMQCSTCTYYQRGECCKDGGKFEGQAMMADEFCKYWREDEYAGQKRQPEPDDRSRT